MIDFKQATRNAMALLRRFTSPQGIDDLPHFDHRGFLDEMEHRAGRSLTTSELRSLAAMVAVYCDHNDIVNGDAEPLVETPVQPGALFRRQAE
jgi:hypothetical protein